ncbi:hypothetical protein KA005_57140, partial [bacterium]|nr:hypothetical protein [bacterium]
DAYDGMSTPVPQDRFFDIEDPPKNRIYLCVGIKKDGKWAMDIPGTWKKKHGDDESVGESKAELKKRLEKLKTIPAKRSKRETRDIRESREKIINKEQLKEKLSVLKGESLQPIRLILRGDKIKGFKLVNFALPEQKRWWTYLKQKSQMSKIAEIAQVYPDGIELLSEAYDIRYRMRYGLPEEDVQARKELDSFQLKARNIPTKFDPLLVPLIRMIAEQFSS